MSEPRRTIDERFYALLPAVHRIRDNQQGEPLRALLAILEHRPRDGVLVASVHRIIDERSTVPIAGALAVAPLDRMPLRRYAVDRLGLTLWRDGFSGPSPSVRATLVFHAIGARPGRPVTPGELMDALRLAH